MPVQLPSSQYSTSSDGGQRAQTFTSSLQEFLEQAAGDRKGTCICMCSGGFKVNQNALLDTTNPTEGEQWLRELLHAEQEGRQSKSPSPAPLSGNVLLLSKTREG